MNGEAGDAKPEVRVYDQGCQNTTCRWMKAFRETIEDLSACTSRGSESEHFRHALGEIVLSNRGVDLNCR